MHLFPLRIGFVSRLAGVPDEGDVQLDLDALAPERQKEVVAFVQSVLDKRETVGEKVTSTSLKIAFMGSCIWVHLHML